MFRANCPPLTRRCATVTRPQTRCLLMPIGLNDTKGVNHYQPFLLTGEDAERVLRKMEKSTGEALPDFDESLGAAVVEWE